MKKYRFTTNIQSGQCLEKIAAYFSANNEIRSWTLELNSPVSVLTVETDSLSSEMVEEIVRNAGCIASAMVE